MISVAFASIRPKPETLAKIVDSVEVAFVAEIEDFTKDTPQTPVLGANTLQLLPTTYALQPRGTYTFRVIHNLKGNSKKTLLVELPELQARSYDYASLAIKKNNIVLVLLKHSPQGDLIAANPSLPLIPLAGHVAEITPKDSDLLKTILPYLLASLNLPELRQTLTYLLRPLKVLQVTTTLSNYVDDPNIEVQDNVLYNLIINQQVDAIPKLVPLAARLSKVGGSPASLTALRAIRKRGAAHYLHALLFERSYSIRLSAIFALDNVATKESIPYLILALRDPDPQHVIPASAYGILHRLASSLGTSAGYEYFIAHQDEEVEVLYEWWKRYLQRSDSNEIAGDIIGNVENQPLDILYKLLFNPSLNTRREAMTAMGDSATQASIPYLIIALHDPNTDISYSAYLKLYRLIGDIGKPKSHADFIKSPSSAIVPIYTWWTQSLQ